MTDNLLPCPFCGGAADPAGWATLPQYAATPEERSGPACDECGASAQTAEAWNTRTVTTYDAKIDALVKALEGIAAALEGLRPLPLVLDGMAQGLIRQAHAALGDVGTVPPQPK